MDDRIWYNISSHEDDEGGVGDDDGDGEIRLRSSSAVWRDLQDCMSERTTTVSLN